jgi:methionyl-tRNA formyltransferase
MNNHRIAFFGTPEFAVPTLQKLINSASVEVGIVITQPDAISGRGKKLNPPPIKIIAQKNNIPVYQPNSLRREINEVIRELDNHAPFDAAVVIAFGQLIPKKLLSYFKNNCINVHASLLPRWRGAAPIHRAILAGDTDSGICLMKMEQGLDTGPVYLVNKIMIDSSDSYLSLHDKLANLGADTLSENINLIIEGKIIPLPQDESQGVTYAHKILKEESQINWNNSAEMIIRQIKAFNGAYTFLNQERVRILEAETIFDNQKLINSGLIYISETGDIEVVCDGNFNLKINKLQIPGRNPVSSVEFLRGYNKPLVTFQQYHE